MFLNMITDRGRVRLLFNILLFNMTTLVGLLFDMINMMSMMSMMNMNIMELYFATRSLASS